MNIIINLYFVDFKSVNQQNHEFKSTKTIAQQILMIEKF